LRTGSGTGDGIGMRLGILADIHEHVGALQRSLAVLKDRGVDRFVFLGEVFELGHRLEETVTLLADAGAVGVWGNHDFGLCGDRPTPDIRRRYSASCLEYLGRLRPRLEVEGCLFTHIEPWLDPEKLEDLWYFEGPLDTPERVAQIFGAAPNRVMFVGHYHRWLLVSPEGLQPWAGEGPIILRPEGRHLMVVHAVCDGKCALFDTITNELVPFDVGRGG
jgi:predicted phosphodiesterase